MFTSLLPKAGMILALFGAAAMGGAPAPQESSASDYLGGPYKVIAADFTGDGIVDLAVGHHGIDAVTIEQGDGKGEFSRLAIFAVPLDNRPIEGVINLACGDVDGDGLLDLALGVGGTKDSPPGRLVLARNLGGGRFERMAQFPLASMAKGVALADLDKDGRLDLVGAARGSGNKNDLATGRLVTRQGFGNWKFGPPLEYEAGESAYYTETADLNRDGFPDILIPNEHKPTVQVYLNPGKDCFKSAEAWDHRVLTASPIPGRRHHSINDVRAADFDGDGNLDLVSANLGTNTISIFFGNGDGTFQRDTLYDGGGTCAFFAVGDLNGDGRLDFVVTHWTQDFVSVFLNRGDGTFFPGTPYPCGLGCYGVALCDAERGGKLDIVTANYRDRSLSLLIGNGNGSFKPAVTTRSALSLKNGEWVPE